MAQTVNVFDRASIVDRNFTEFVQRWKGETRSAPGELTLDGPGFLELFESQILARHLDLMSRILRAKDRSFYTIGSSGHEGNAVLGRVTRPTDPAFLHYRSGGFVVERARSFPEIDEIYDTLLAQVASTDDPISGGRHKVWGSRPMWVLPQTSTIASHLPKAVGTAIGIRRAAKLGVTPPIPADSIVVCSFGDASLNHSTALGAFSAAARAVYQQVSAPILFVCEDNGIGISVRTPRGWVADAFERRPGLKYFRANGLDLMEAHRVATEAVNCCRRLRRPVFLHLEVVRLLGHAGSDVELEYRTRDEVEQDEARDPLLRSAGTAMELGFASSQHLIDLYEAARRRVQEAADRAVERPRLTSAAEVVRPLAPYSRDAVRMEARRPADAATRAKIFDGREGLPENGAGRHLAASINLALHDLLAKYPQSLVFGEDIALKGGVYNVTAGLLRRFGQPRVFNTILDEQTILGLAQGFGYMGMLPIPEIQYLAYVHNAVDQLRGEACSTQFFSMGQFRNPMVVRIASLGYQKGFGGHFHNDNSVAGLRDIPGLIMACPSRGDDAVGMLRTCMALAQVDGRVTAFLEPIALYMTRDLYEDKDGGWSFPYPAPTEAVDLGIARVYHPEHADVLVITYGNGVRMSLRAAKSVQEQDGTRVRVLDLRWLNPLDEEAIVRHAGECGRVVVVDEGRRTGGVGEAIVAIVAERSERHVKIRRVTGMDTYIPLGPAAQLVLPSEEDVAEAIRGVRS